MFISKKKLDEMLQRAREDAIDDIYARQKRERTWCEIYKLRDRVDKLEQRLNCYINGEPELKEAPPVALQANPF